MRTWAKATFGILGVIAVGIAALAGTGAYFVLRHMDERTAQETEAIRAIEAVKARFGPRPPLVEIIDPRKVDIRINRPTEPSTTRVDTIHIISWKSETHELSRADVPLWLMRFSTLSIASQLGIAPVNLRLTVSDIERYGPGIIVDYGSPGAFRMLLWVE